MCCIWGFRSFTSVPLGGRGCWYWPYTSKMPDQHRVTAHPEIILILLYIFHFSTKEESQSRNYALDSYPGCSSSQRWDQLWLWNISKLQPPHPKLGAALDAPSKNLHFHQAFFPVHSLFVLLAFIDSAAVAPVQFISSQRAWSRYPYQQRMLSEMPPGVFQVVSNYLWEQEWTEEY